MGMTNQGGKGSGARPLSVDRNEFAQKFDGIFGEKKRTNGGWTPPPLPTDTPSNEVALPSGATVTIHIPKPRPNTGDSGYRFSTDAKFDFTDNPSTTEDGVKKE